MRLLSALSTRVLSMPRVLERQRMESMRALLLDVGLLILRLGAGGLMLFGHGIKKATKYATLSETFSDPLGIGAVHSLNLAIFAEVLCAAMVMLGFATRVAAINVAITMCVAAFVVHANDPWPKAELALAYLMPFVALALTGAGRYSIDGYRSPDE